MRRYRLQQLGITLLGAALIVLVFWMLTGAGHAASAGLDSSTAPLRGDPQDDAGAGKALAHEIAEMVRAAGHPEDHPVILACQEWWRSEDAKERAAQTNQGDPVGAQQSGSDGERNDSGAYELCTSEQSESRARGSDDWPVAAEVWNLLRRSGLSEVCCAGILGNMAAECGGGTLELLPYTYAGGYYGLCMWSLYYVPQADGLSVPDQVQLLLDTLESNLRAGGGSLSDFHACTDARSAARYFSDYYERPAAWSETRANAAEAALREFGGGA